MLGISIEGNYAYLGFQYDGLFIIHVADPTSPTQAGYYNTGGDSCKVVAKNRRAGS